MNQLIAQKTASFSLILGTIIGIISTIQPVIGLALFVLAFCSSAIIMIYMRRNKQHLSYLTNEQGAIMGGIIGFCATLGFFATFSPLVCIFRMISQKYYAYMIPDMLSNALWLFFIIIFMVALIFAATNSVVGMGIAWLLGRIEKKPEHHDARLDIKIED